MKVNLKKLFGLGGSDTEPISSTESDSISETPKVKAEKEGGLPPAPQKRKEILGFIIQKLRPYIDEGIAPVLGLQFYALCLSNEEEELFNKALHSSNPGEFKSELQRELANNHIKPVDNWVFTFEIVRTKLPECKFVSHTFGLNLVSDLHKVGHHPKARLITLKGQTAQKEYVLKPEEKQSYLIGREHTPELASGRVRINDIYFLAESDSEFDPIKGAANLSVSRNHARIGYDPVQKKYFLSADEGGLPSRGNKIKILKTNDVVIRADVLGMKYELVDGDQIELGGETKLLFQIS
jgi:hypothetical protein